MKWATWVGDKLLVTADAAAETTWNPTGVSSLDQDWRTSEGLSTLRDSGSWRPEAYNLSYSLGSLLQSLDIPAVICWENSRPFSRPNSGQSPQLISFQEVPCANPSQNTQSDLLVLAFLTSHPWRISWMETSLEGRVETKADQHIGALVLLFGRFTWLLSRVSSAPIFPKHSSICWLYQKHMGQSVFSESNNCYKRRYVEALCHSETLRKVRGFYYCYNLLKVTVQQSHFEIRLLQILLGISVR